MTGSIGDDALGGRLRRLKRHGCALPITGEVGDRTRAEATRRLLGAPLEPRRRVLVLVDPTVGTAEDRLPTGAGPADDSVVVDARVGRGASRADAGRTDVDPAGAERVRTLRERVVDAVGDVSHGTLEEGEFRSVSTRWRRSPPRSRPTSPAGRLTPTASTPGRCRSTNRSSATGPRPASARWYGSCGC
jgi:hypothetical protein